MLKTIKEIVSEVIDLCGEKTTQKNHFPRIPNNILKEIMKIIFYIVSDIHDAHLAINDRSIYL
jgi:hypothetical protein